MNECVSIDMTQEEIARYNAYKQQQKMAETKASILKLECDCLSPTQDKASLKQLLKEAVRLGLGGVCVAPCHVAFCSKTLGPDTCVSVIACASYPHGGETTEVKVKAVKQAIKDGADEVEVTAPIILIKEGAWGLVKREFKKIKAASRKRAVRVTVEAPLLTEAEIIKCCSLAADAGIPCVRTASGVYGAGNDETHIRTMQKAAKDRLLIKASCVTVPSQFSAAIAHGASLVSAHNALQIAEFMLTEASKSGE